MGGLGWHSLKADCGISTAKIVLTASHFHNEGLRSKLVQIFEYGDFMINVVLS